MTVYHPRTLDTVGGAPPGGVTVDGVTYHVATDGSIDCPAGAEDAIADQLAEAYGVDPGEVYEEDGPPDSTVPEQTPDATPDFDGLTYDELYTRAQERDIAGRSEMDSDELRAALRED